MEEGRKERKEKKKKDRRKRKIVWLVFSEI